MAMEYILSAIHTVVDVVITTLFTAMWVQLMMAIDVRNTRKRQEQKQNRQLQIRTTNASLRFVQDRKTCPSNPLAGFVLSVHLGYYDRGTSNTNTIFNEEVENATRFGTDNLDLLPQAMDSALKVSAELHGQAHSNRWFDKVIYSLFFSTFATRLGHSGPQLYWNYCT
jgi:hypothetical protein